MVIRSFCCRGFIAVAILVNVHCGSDREPQRPDILLITIDTLRADSLEPYGATDTLTPNIEALADQGVVYEAATTPMPLTRPAHASILTGLYPDQHGVLTNHQVLPEDDVTLAEILSDAGYQTAGFTGIRFLNRRSGLAQEMSSKGPSNGWTAPIQNARSCSGSTSTIPTSLMIHPEDSGAGSTPNSSAGSPSSDGGPSTAPQNQTTGMSLQMFSTSLSTITEARWSTPISGSADCWKISIGFVANAGQWLWSPRTTANASKTEITSSTRIVSTRAPSGCL